MVFVKTPTDILLNPNVSPTSKTVYSLLLFFHREGNERGCFCKKSTLCKYLSISETTVRKSLNELKEMGFITIDKRSGRTDVIKVVRISFIEEPVEEPVVTVPVMNEQVEEPPVFDEPIPPQNLPDTPVKSTTEYLLHEVDGTYEEFMTPIVETITSSKPEKQSKPVSKENRSDFYGLKKVNDGQQWKEQLNEDRYGSKCEDPTQYINRLKELLRQRK